MIKKIFATIFKMTILFLGCVTVFSFVDGTIPNPFLSKPSIPVLMSEVQKVKIREATFNVDIAINEESRALGLSGRSYLSVLQGMLFVFESSDAHLFWMKGMLFPIDIIWIDENKQIMEIAEDVQPNSFPKQFGSNKKSLYVLEIPAGTAERFNFKIGDTVEFLR
jgi:hypothetical protein